MIFVSLTTIPERLGKRLPFTCIESILKQSIRPDKIVVNIPKISKKGISYSQELAIELSTLDPIIHVQFGVSDIGPITKLIPTLDLLKSNNIDDALIILVDDDCTYNIRMIENLIKHKQRHPEEFAIGTSGRLKQRGKLEFVGLGSHLVPCPEFMHVDIIETFPGVLYDYRLFKDTDFVQWVLALPTFVLIADDIILSSWTKKQGKKLYKVVQNNYSYVRHDPKNTTELNKINDIGGNNNKVYDYFEECDTIRNLIKPSPLRL